jgi:M6 family metalloprotease-like protein
MRPYAAVIISLMILIGTAQAVPLRPDVLAQLRNQGRLPAIQALVEDARARGLDAPTTHPFRPRDLDMIVHPDTLHALVILVDFLDNPADTITYPPSHFQDLLFSRNVCRTGSLNDYYLEVSYNGLLFQGDVIGSYRMPQPYAYYTHDQFGFGTYPLNAQKLAEDAVLAADPDVDFSLYDNDHDGYVEACYVVHAGPGGEVTGDPADIWSHTWSTHNYPHVDGVIVNHYSTDPEDGNIGIFCHETGHLVFGLPDLYDLDAPPFDSWGLGVWSLMAYGCWLNGGLTPAHPDAYCKTKAGFLTPQIVGTNTASAQFPCVEYNQVIYKLWTDGLFGSEYFLAENRQRAGFDQYLPGDGLLIYHVDETRINNNRPWYPGYTSFGHYLVALEQADGNWDLEQNVNSGDDGDPWPGSSAHSGFDYETLPTSQSYDFHNTLVGIRNIRSSKLMVTADLSVESGHCPPDTAWTRTFGGSNYEYGYCVRQTVDRGYIICGSTRSYGWGSVDVWLIKVDRGGNQQWIRTFGGTNAEEGHSVQQTADGGYIIAGNTYSFGAGSSDAWLIKTDDMGYEQWNVTFGGSYEDLAYSVNQTADGGYIIAGYTKSYASYHYYSDAWLIKTDSLGNKQWHSAFGGNSTDVGRSAQQTADGGFIVAGYTYSYGAGSSDAWLIKTDSMGNERWNHTFGGSSEDFANDVQQTVDGGYIMVGTTKTLYPDVWLIKTDIRGNRQWSRIFGGIGYNDAYSVQQTSDCGYIIAGSRDTHSLSHGDFLWIKTDWRGNQEWISTFGGNGYDNAQSIQQTTDGGYIIAGYTTSHGAGYYDVCLIRVEGQIPAAVDERNQYPSPTDFSLYPLYPNPFNSTATLTFSLPWTSQISLIIYTIEGRKVAEVLDGQYQPGLHRIGFNASDLSSGVYFARLLAPGFTQTQKMVVLK